MILRARWVVDRTLEVHENHCIRLGEGSVRSPVASSETDMDLGDCVLMPGLVNAHCHLDYTDMRGRIPSNGDFVSWIGEIKRRKRLWSESDYVRSIERGLDEALKFGTTCMGNWVCSKPVKARVAMRSMRMWWFLEQIAFRESSPSESWLDWGDGGDASKMWRHALAPHALYTCRSEVVGEAVDWSSAREVPWSIHIAESREEFEMFRHARGPLFALLQNLGRDMKDCGRGTPLECLRPHLRAAGSPILLVHANCLEESDFDLLNSLDVRVRAHISIVHCPRSHLFFGHPPFPLGRLREIGLNVCLGTDSLASNADLSLFSEMNLLSQRWADLEAREIVRMATICGAQALGCREAWGEWRDWIAIPVSIGSKADVWKGITRFTGKPIFVMVDGQVLSSL